LLTETRAALAQLDAEIARLKAQVSGATDPLLAKVPRATEGAISAGAELYSLMESSAEARIEGSLAVLPSCAHKPRRMHSAHTELTLL
jgi:hypothetical protein